jgi:hypothetical protein
MLSSYDGNGNLQSADSVLVGYIGEKVSYGRYPDGADDLYVMNRMTFANTNYYSPYNQLVRFTVDDVAVEAIEAEDALPMISYQAATKMISVNIPTYYALPIQLDVYDLQGRRVATFSIGEHTAQVSLASLPTGVYVVRIAGVSIKIHR